MPRVTDHKQKVKMKIKAWDTILGKKKLGGDGTTSSGTGLAKICNFMKARSKSKNE